MKCPKCQKHNNDNINYCYKCGYEYSEKEKKLAKNTGFRGVVNKYKKYKNYFTLNFITGKIWFKVLSILIILAIGILNIYNNGSKFRILNNDNYTYQYNKKEKEYYLYVKKEETPLSLYMPGNSDKITIDYYNNQDKLISSNTHNKDNEIKVLANITDDNYYKITYNKKTIKIRVYNKDDVGE